MIKVPNVRNICPLVIVHPVRHNNTIIDLSNKHVAECKKETHPLNNCREGSGMPTCRIDRFDKCLTMIFNSNAAICKTTSSYHIAPHERVDDNTIIINDATISEGNQKLNLTEHSVSVTLPYLHQVHLRNLHKIDKFNSEARSTSRVWYIMVTILAIVGCILVIYLKCHHKQPNISPVTTNFNMETEVERIVRNIAESHQKIRDESV